MSAINNAVDFTRLAEDVKAWGKQLGFQQVAIADCNLNEADEHLSAWLEKQFHGSMSYMAENRDKRRHPELLVPGTIRIITVRMDYLPQDDKALEILNDPSKAYISRYALGRDYHKVIRQRLRQLAAKINDIVGQFNYRAFTDSAPIFERALAEKSGLGWIGKSSMLINKDAGSWFFLGTLYTNLPLPLDEPVTEHCGSCTACLDVCPTQAIVAPYQVDARRCISYLTIENKKSIPEEFRKAIGNRIYGCDDCQLVCPWNKFAKTTEVEDFTPRHELTDADLIALFAWTEGEFLKRTEGMAMRRATYTGWLRNIAVALGNAPTSEETINALKSRANHPNEIVREHVAWALRQHKTA